MSEYTINKIEYDGNIYNLQDANAGTGTVTSIGISNATNGGLSVSGSPVTTSGSITVGHSNVLDSAQTTQAVYPIKIDKNGHISEYGSAVTIPDVSGKIDTAGTGLSKSGTTLNHTNSITAQTTSAVYPIKIDAQGHISEYDSAVTIPTNTNQLTNGAGFITSPNIPYCTCDTAAATIAKVATVVSGTFTADNMVTGAQIIVKFTNNNTKSDATLKVGSTDVKTIKRYGTTSTSTSAATSWNAGSCILFIYDGTYWQMAGWLNSTYSEASVAEITSSSSSTARLISGRRAASAVAAFESITDVTVGGTSVVNNRVAEIPEVNADIVVHVLGTYGDGTLTYTADYTFEEIQLAIEDGHSVVCCYYEYYPESEEYADQRDLYYLYSYKINEEAYDQFDGIIFTSVLPTSGGSIEGGQIIFKPSGDIECLYGSVQNTDEKLSTTTDAVNSTEYYPIFGSNSSTASKKKIDSTGFKYSTYTGTSNVTGSSILYLGNNTAAGTAGNKIGYIKLYGATQYSYTITGGALNPLADRTLTLPDKSGTIALTSDLPTIPSNNVTGSGSTNYLAEWSGTNTLSSTSLYFNTSYNSGSDSYGTIKLYVGSTGQIDWRGQLVFHDGSSSKTITITPPSLTASRTLTLPDKTGTIALTSDIPDVSGKIDTAGIGLSKSGTTLKAKLNSETAITDTSKVYYLGVDSDGYLITKVGWSDIQTRTSDSGAARTIYLAGGTTSSDETGGLSKHASISATVSANSATAGTSYLTLGNSTASSTAGGKEGYVRLYGSSTSYTDLKVSAATSAKTITFPDKTGTVALTSDIPTVPTITLNGSSTTSPSFYAPTGVGTSGYVLTSNGSGTPSWSNSTATPTASTISKFDSSAKMNSTDMSSSDIDTFIAGLNTGVSDYIQRSELGDYVIEQSSSGTHYYKIYNSGKKEVWGMFTETCDSMTAFGTNTGLYRVTKTLALPTYMTAGITTVECLNATVISTGGSGYCTAWSAYISNNTNLVITIIGSAANAGDVKFSYHIIGN